MLKCLISSAMKNLAIYDEPNRRAAEQKRGTHTHTHTPIYINKHPELKFE
jgi:hypothetical protein